MNNKLHKKDMTVGTVAEISEALEHDLFADLSAEFRKEMQKKHRKDLSRVEEAVVEYNTVSYAEYKALLVENLDLYRKLEKLRDRLEAAPPKVNNINEPH